MACVGLRANARETAVAAISVTAFCCLCSAPVAQAEESPSWFLGAYGGWQSFDSALDVDEGDIDLLFDPEDEGDSLGLRLGYHLNERWYATAEYHRVDADDTEIDNWMLSINRRWQLSDHWTWSAGLVAGESTLDWQDAPIETRNRDRESETFLWGAQTALGYSLGERWQLELRYQFLAHEHETRLRPTSGRGEYNHEEFHHISIGVDFRF